jgi:hypothetical protein
MEPNNNLGPSDQNASGRQGEANEFSGSASSQSSGFDFKGSTGASGISDESQGSQGLKDRARSAIGNAGDRLGDVGSTIRDRAGSAKNRLADALETGADKLRSQGGSSATFAGATGEGSTAIPADGKVGQVSEKLAGGMQATADWLREAELDDLKSGIENQIREHPGRTLVIALGLGYLIGRAFRNNS